MADIIKLLPDHVANQIAAGEVVQRPASVVKELLENALDAEADAIKLIVKDAGKTLIQVIDNGKGMSETDARMSFERHATSKIKDAEDLFALRTKGFRGEALASIAAVSHVELKTRTDDSEVGICIVIEGSAINSQEPVATVKGTTIAVKNLFFNIPARRNFLKSQTVELRHVIDEFHRVALAHPHVAFVMYHNDGELFNLPKCKLRQRIVNIFGPKTNEKLVPVTEETEIVTINGYVFKPEFAKKSRGEQFFFVNDRFIKSPYLHHAVSGAFEGLLPDRARASYFLFLEVDPKTIDINIHPTKTEIKFEDEHALYAVLRAAIKHSLGQFSVAPVLDFDRDSSLDTPYGFKGKPAVAPRVEVDRDFNPFTDVQLKGKSAMASPTYEKQNASGWQNLYSGMDSRTIKGGNGFSSVQYEEVFDNNEAFAKAETDPATTYQLHRKYIVSTIKSGMVVIDQHRAHQRILYEELLQQISGNEAVSQQLLFPLQLDFSQTEVAALQKLRPMMESAGFIFEKMEGEQVEVSGIPTVLNAAEMPIVMEQLLNDLENEVPEVDFSPQEKLVKSLSKSMAVRAGEVLGDAQRENLVNRLFACREPHVTPANRKTFITLDLGDLEKMFN